jgi:hypothetical protein
MSFFAKMAGWGQFAVGLFNQVLPLVTGPNQPHGAFSWTNFGISLLTAIAVHGAASTDGVK